MAITYRTLPVPAFLEHTALVPAGAITIGVEYRHLDEAMILRFYGPDARAKFDGVAPAGMGAVVEEDGIALHVFGTADREEYLRFDCFIDAPHYHELEPHEPRNVVHELDPADDAVAFALTAIEGRVVAMLRAAGAGHLADAVDPAAVAAAMPEVRAQVDRMLRAGAPVLV
jgi:hypothetical protein